MTDRIERLCSLFQEEIAGFVMKERRESASGFVTITGVKISKSLENALIFYSVMGPAEQRQTVQLELERLRGPLAAALRKRIKIKRLPSFAFKYDETPLRAARLETLFHKIESEQKPEANETQE